MFNSEVKGSPREITKMCFQRKFKTISVSDDNLPINPQNRKYAIRPTHHGCHEMTAIYCFGRQTNDSALQHVSLSHSHDFSPQRRYSFLVL